MSMDDENNTCSGLNNNWTCPREASVMPDKSCIQQSSSSSITSTKEFQDVLQQDCSVSASLSGSYGGLSGEASFSGSKAMASMQNKITKDQVTTFQSKAVCVEYSATLKLGFQENQLEPLPEFESAVGGLPHAYKSCFLPDAVGGPCPKRVASAFGDLPPTKTSSRRLQDSDTTANNCGCDTSLVEYFRFIQWFGTHYTTYVEMGGKIIHRLEIKNSDVETLTDKKVDIAFGASIKASFSGVVASVGASVEVNGARSDGAKAFNSVMQVAQKEININVGGSPSDQWQTWAQSTTDTPMPIRYRLSSLVDLIQVVDPLKVAPFETAVQDYIAAYGKSLSFEMSPDAKVQSVEIKYSIDTGIFDWVQFRVMIGPKGSMLPVDVRMYNTTGSFKVDVPARFHYSFGAFDDKVPVTLQYASGPTTREQGVDGSREASARRRPQGHADPSPHCRSHGSREESAPFGSQGSYGSQARHGSDGCYEYAGWVWVDHTADADYGRSTGICHHVGLHGDSAWRPIRRCATQASRGLAGEPNDYLSRLTHAGRPSTRIHLFFTYSCVIHPNHFLHSVVSR